jgi:nucleoside-diphosphate-sugar epimerase
MDKEIVQVILEWSHWSRTYIDNPIKNYVRDTLADTSKCREILGFEAKISLQEGIRRIAVGYIAV